MDAVTNVDWIDELDHFRACGGVGVILSFNTSDRVFVAGEKPVLANLRYFLAAKYYAEGVSVGYFSLSKGFSVMVPPGGESKSKAMDRLNGSRNLPAVLEALGPVLRDRSERSVLLFDYADHIAPSVGQGMVAGLSPEQINTVETLHQWSLDDDIRAAENSIVLIGHEGGINSLLQQHSGFHSITIELPREELRRQFTSHLLAMQARGGEQPGVTLEDGLTIRDFARVTSGLRLVDIEKLLCEGAVTGNPVTRNDIREIKKSTINQLCGGLLEVVDPTLGFDAVAGANHAKDYFKSIQPLWGSGHASLPQAILLAGVPGGGKSFLIKALAREFNCPCLIMRGVRESWVGQSERNLDRVLQVAQNLAPCILWTDEVDQTVGGERSGGPSGDSGTSDRMLGRLLEFFGDSRTRGQILWVATTNRPDLLDVAIKDRFSVKIPFLHPTADEREALLPMLAGQVERQFGQDVDAGYLARRAELEMLTVRGLQEIVVWAATLADMEAGVAGSEIALTHIESAIVDYNSTYDPMEHELIALIALRMTTFSSLLPWVGLRGFDPEKADWPPYLEGMVDVQTGRLDSALLVQRITELQQQRAQRGAW